MALKPPLPPPTSRSSVSSIQTSFATSSLGLPTDPLPYKLRAISLAGFKSIELAFPDLVAFASEYHKKEIKDWDLDNLCIAGEEVKKLCVEYGLSILMLQPLVEFEGWPSGSTERTNAFQKATAWIKIMKAIGTDMLLVGSTSAILLPPGREEIYNTNQEMFANHLARLADMLQEHSFRLAYEPRSWSAKASTWSTCFEIINLANRPNIGLCLDTFHIAAAEWADPITHFHMTGNQQRLAIILEASLTKLVQTVPKDRIYVLQISDAYKLPDPVMIDKAELDAFYSVITGHVRDNKRRAKAKEEWSRDYRTFPENGGCLPVRAITKAVLETGFRGYCSLEIYDGGQDGGRLDFSGRRGRVNGVGFNDFVERCKRELDALLERCVVKGP